MSRDLPRVDYRKEKKNGYTKKDYDESVIANEAIYQRYLAMKEAEKGKKIDLTKLMNT